MVRKSTMSRVTTAIHATRARMSLEPDKRIFVALETTAPPALFCSVFNRLIHLSHSQKRRKTQRLREKFLSFSTKSFHIPVTQSLQKALRTARLQKPSGVVSSVCTRQSKFFNTLGELYTSLP